MSDAAPPGAGSSSSAGPCLVRDARPSDVPTIVEYNQRLAVETETKTLDPAVLTLGVEALFADASRGRYFVAEIDGEVVGQLMLTYEWSDWRNGVIWWVQSVYVAASYRRRGVLRTLFDHVARQAALNPEVRGLRLYVENENRAAQTAYTALGFADASYLVMERWSPRPEDH